MDLIEIVEWWLSEAGKDDGKERGYGERGCLGSGVKLGDRNSNVLQHSKANVITNNWLGISEQPVERILNIPDTTKMVSV